MEREVANAVSRASENLRASASTTTSRGNAGESEKWSRVEDNWECWSDDDRVVRHGRRGGKGGATSGTRSDSIRGRWLKMPFSMKSTSARLATYLDYPHHSGSVPDDQSSSSTHRVVEENSNRHLEVSVEATDLAKSYDCVKIMGGKSESSEAR